MNTTFRRIVGTVVAIAALSAVATGTASAATANHDRIQPPYKRVQKAVNDIQNEIA